MLFYDQVLGKGYRAWPIVFQAFRHHNVKVLQHTERVRVVVIEVLLVNLAELVPNRKERQRLSVLELYIDPHPDLFCFGACLPVFQIEHGLLECVFVVFAPLADPKKYLN